MIDLYPRTYRGLKVVVMPVHSVPALQLSEAVTVTDKFRREFNAWLISMFGYKEVCTIQRGEAWINDAEGIVFMHPDTARALEEQIGLYTYPDWEQAASG